ncbi:triple tyrosine motif-containing protein [Neptunitalea lumnitzerae]|uniref:HTH luxR-type domain-containing protein n=1 Tax=Neptunitalea lumnitzerae TaxID=2965509 RepID=A0ABQ5MEB2_9FLAO|nr:triple tyrosine motif-containing protein [Neptunitalea sp. Y10]GLB47688.1 hypothetical protein Y10_00560 [Neptunitalea sp. Y10]
MKIISIKVVFLFFLTYNLFAQELPPIIKFETEDYQAGNQNWMISQNNQEFMYVANHMGLLEYDGASWKLYDSPNETIIRSVKVVGSRVYTGCYMEFGYWEKTKDGRLVYTSLSDTIKDRVLDDEQIWNIINYRDWIIFQSLDQLFIYDVTNGSFTVHSPKGGLTKVFNIGASVYYQTMGRGIYEIVNGNDVLVSDNEVVKETKVVNLLKSDKGLVVHTQLSGLFYLKEGELVPFEVQIPPNNIYNSIQLSNGDYALGTVSDGVYIIEPSGKIKLHINQENGLTNNTVLSLFEDIDHNLWVGLDNGVNCINLGSKVESYEDDSGMLGTIYASVLHQDKLYLGTNQGLFYKPYDENIPFKLISNTKGQVWSLFVYNNQLFCGHDSGTFLVDDTTATRIFSESGTWKFETITEKPDILLQGNYAGISVLKNVNGTWQLRNWIEGFNYSTRYLEKLDNTLYVSHEYKGVFKVEVNDSITKALKVEMLEEPKKGKNISITKYQNQIWFASKEGVYSLASNEGRFKQNQTLSDIMLNDGYTSGKLIVDKQNRLWFFTKNHINYFTHSKFDNSLVHQAIPIPYTLANTMWGYENISFIEANKYLIGSVNGYYLIDPEEKPSDTYRVYLDGIQNYKLNDTVRFLNLQDVAKLNYKQNNVMFSYTIPQYLKYANAEYQYILEGFNTVWSEYSLETQATFKNLPPGDYVFKVRGKVGDRNTENVEVYQFTILKPWFATNTAIIIYLVILLIAGFVINMLYKNYYEKQRLKLIEENQREIEIHQLEASQQLMKTKTEMLEKDIESKNRELAASTLNLIKKNEVLASIKSDLKKLDSTQNVKSVISTINANINEEDTWNLFSEAFNNADKDFLKKIKDIHPSLTPNDLRLCAYLRLNLTSKEIAPLLNISVRSVEIKRYRLRKKMDLAHEQGLIEYILSI